MHDIGQCIQAKGDLCAVCSSHPWKLCFSHCLEVKRQVRGECNNQWVKERSRKEESEMESGMLVGGGVGGLWLVGRGQKKEGEGTERMETGREKWEDGKGVTANRVGLAEERQQYRGRERVGRRQVSDSSTTGRGPLNDSLFLHDFNSWQSTGLLVASWQLYHYLLALSLLCILRLSLWRVDATGHGG